jgi:1-acyl-sn-glycerol-3-phosphate acyltransferase
MSAPRQLRLLLERRFLPYFIAQALGACNDNLLKNLVVLAATYHTLRYTRLDARVLASVAGMLFLLPFLVFSGTAGQLADRWDKSRIIRLVKTAELGIMALAAGAFFLHSLVLLLTTLLLMGVNSSFLAPAKYGLLPQVLRPRELLSGNALLQTGTFLSILAATVMADAIAGGADAATTAMILCLLAVIGWLASLAIPPASSGDADLHVDFNPWRATADNVRAAREKPAVWLALLGLAWFWFYCMLVLTQLPVYAHVVLNGSEQVYTLLLVVFAAGVSLGALLCAPLAGGKVEIGLVPLGSIGLTLFMLDLAWASVARTAAETLGVHAFLGQPHALRLLVDLAGVGFSGGIFVVPLQALVQQRARAGALGRVIAVNSVMNALLTLLAAAFGAAALALVPSVPLLLLLIALMNAVVAAYIYTLIPEFLLRLLSWLLMQTIYRIWQRGVENFPERAAALLVCNHVSFVDALVISAACPRPIRFVMENAIFSAPVIHLLARGMKAVPITPRREDAKIYEQAFATVAQELRDGQLVCIFPEGRLTTDGEVGEFRPGLMRILAETPVPVVPMALSGLWGSVFSRHSARLLAPLVQSPSARIGIAIGPAVPAAEATPEGLRARVLALRESA